jgi:hypothetical protein
VLYLTATAAQDRDDGTANSVTLMLAKSGGAQLLSSGSFMQTYNSFRLDVKEGKSISLRSTEIDKMIKWINTIAPIASLSYDENSGMWTKDGKSANPLPHQADNAVKDKEQEEATSLIAKMKAEERQKIQAGTFSGRRQSDNASSVRPPNRALCCCEIWARGLAPTCFKICSLQPSRPSPSRRADEIRTQRSSSTDLDADAAAGGATNTRAEWERRIGTRRRALNTNVDGAVSPPFNLKFHYNDIASVAEKPQRRPSLDASAPPTRRGSKDKKGERSQEASNPMHANVGVPMTVLAGETGSSSGASNTSSSGDSNTSGNISSSSSSSSSSPSSGSSSFGGTTEGSGDEPPRLPTSPIRLDPPDEVPRTPKTPLSLDTLPDAKTEADDEGLGSPTEQSDSSQADDAPPSPPPLTPILKISGSEKKRRSSTPKGMFTSASLRWRGKDLLFECPNE